MLGNHDKKLAVLIDADNAQPKIVKNLFPEIAKLGIATTKRIYGDWTTQALQGWKGVLLQYSIQPIQQFAYTTGKNATDSALIIDAVDLLYTDNFDGFCIVSSDSDFTKLASRIRESGLTVYGFGEEKTPDAFRSACEKFILAEVPRKMEVDQKNLIDQPITRKTGSQLKQDTKLVQLLRNAVDEFSDDSGWTHLGLVGNYISRQKQDFNPRNYGYSKLNKLIKATGSFDTEYRGTVLYVRVNKQ